MIKTLLSCYARYVKGMVQFKLKSPRVNRRYFNLEFGNNWVSKQYQ